MIVRKKILVVGPSWVGDMMMAQVLFQLLHRENPHCIIHVLAPAWSEALLSRMNEVQKSIVLPFSHGELQLKKRFQFAKTLRAEKYDQAIVLPNSLKSALIPFWAGIPIRTGWKGELRFGLLNDIRFLDKQKYPKMVARFAALSFARDAILPTLPMPQLKANADNIGILLQNLDIKCEKPVLALCPGAEFGPSKCWPAEYYAFVANAKLTEGWQVWLLGSDKDKAITDQIQTLTQSRCLNLAGKTKLGDAVDLLSLATCVVTNDSGLMHIAAAVNVKVIAIYGSTSPDFTPPLSNQASVMKLNLDCQPCFKRVCPLKHHNCMKQLEPVVVLNVIG